MGAIRSKGSKPARQLGELLQEQQEPFILEVYLAERGLASAEANLVGCRGNSGKFLSSQNQSKKSIPHFPKVLKIILLCKKFCKVKGLRTKNSDAEIESGKKLGVTNYNTQETADSDRFSSASCTTVYYSCSDNDIDEPSMFTRENKADADAKFQWSLMEGDNKQHSPQSVLEEISTSTELDSKDSILSASLWSFLVQTAVPAEESSSCSNAGLTISVGRRGPNCCSALSTSKWVVQRTKQLLLDCVRESMERKHVEIGKVRRKETRESKLRKMLLDSTKDKEYLYWGDYEKEREDIGVVIGNAIVEEITSEVVMDMMIDDAIAKE